MTVKGSAGAGNWAEVPWVGIFDPLVTTSATRGYYPVYLFSEDGSQVHLSLNQGTTAALDEFGARAFDALKDRAALIRTRLKDFQAQFPPYDLSLGSNLKLPRAYEAAHALGRSYSTSALPDEDTLRNDLQTLLQAYVALTYRGGLDPTPEIDGRDIASDDQDASKKLTEVRRYLLHRKIDRHPEAAKKAKQHHGYVCQVCSFDFEKVYGDLGKNFIEAHHLRPLGQLIEGVPIEYDVRTDFAVLCSNCHRMIHRLDNPADMNALLERIQQAKRPA